MHYLEKHKTDVAVIQETKFTSKSKMKKTPNYRLVRKDRGGDIKGGGVAFLVHQDVPFQLVQSPNSLKDDDHLEELTIKLSSTNNDLYIRNVYIPPASSCTQGYTPPFNNITDGTGESLLLLGDINAHNPLWYSDDTADRRGLQLADWLEGTNLGILNDNQPTRTTNNSSTAPDVSITTPDCLPTCTWSVDTSLSSDHLPIHINMTKEIKKTTAPQKTFVNFKKANWDDFTAQTEEKFASAPLTTNVHESEKIFRRIINKAAKNNIPAGRIPKIFNAMPTETADLIDERDQIRKEDPADPRIQELNTNINNKIKEHRQEKWIDHLKNCGQGTKKLWDTIKSINNPPQQPDNQSIKFNNKHYDKPKKLASKFNAQYTPGATTKPTKEFRNLLRKVKKKSSDPEVVITPAQTRKAIKKCKNSKALGPDEISPIMLKHLGPNGINFLTNLFNNSISQAIIPPLWKVGRIIPLLKPKKPADEGTSYRPISLLSPPAKILESILHSQIEASVDLADHQHGFRKGRSTTTALQEITDHIKTGLNMKKPANRTVLVAVDLSKAFDTVNHETLLREISELNLNANIKRWIFSYIRGRQTYVEFRGAKSRVRKMRQGVPQGGVLSPLFFNLYMAPMPPPPPPIKVITYADDGNALCSGPKIGPLCDQLNGYLDTLDTWFSAMNLQISAAKSMATIFTTFSNEAGMELPIHIKGKKVPTWKDPKILGVTLDPMMTFKYHAKNLKEKISSRNNILKALAGSSWGKEKEILLTTYKAISGSVLNYAAPIWTPTLSDTNWNELQTTQNAALRTATGCVKMTGIDHLHSEAKCMPVKDHNHMLSKQFLLSTLRPTHVNHADINMVPPRLMKETLTSKFATVLRPYLQGDVIADDLNYKEGLKSIHTDSVRDVIERQEPNKVLRTPAPTISPSEKTLPRRTRVLLAQLRSGYSSILNSYLARINPLEHADRCPNCDESPHDTTHLFNCPSNPTSLTEWSLWEDPPAAARFLGLDAGPDELPP